MGLEAFYKDTPQGRLYSIWTTISSGWVTKDSPITKALAVLKEFSADMGYTFNEQQARDFLKAAEPIAKFKVYTISREEIMKYAERENVAEKGNVKTDDELILAMIMEAAPKDLKAGKQKNRIEAVKTYLAKHGLKINQVQVFYSKDDKFLDRKSPTKPPTLKQRQFGKIIGSTSGKTGLAKYRLFVVPRVKSVSLLKAKNKAAASGSGWNEIKRIILELASEEPTIHERVHLEDELKNHIDPADYGLESIQQILYDEEGEAARMDIARKTGLSFDDFENMRLAEGGIKGIK